MAQPPYCESRAFKARLARPRYWNRESSHLGQHWRGSKRWIRQSTLCMLGEQMVTPFTLGPVGPW